MRGRVSPHHHPIIALSLSRTSAPFGKRTCLKFVVAVLVALGDRGRHRNSGGAYWAAARPLEMLPELHLCALGRLIGSPSIKP